MMDRLPRFRRRAKHPTLKTDSSRPMTAPPAAPRERDHDATTPAPPVAPPAAAARRPQPERFLKAAARKGLHLRSANKRARSPAAPNPAPPPPPPPLFSPDVAERDVGMDRAGWLSSSPASAAGRSDASEAEGGVETGPPGRVSEIETGPGREGEIEAVPGWEGRVGATGRGRRAAGDTGGPMMPHFLTYSDHDILRKFQELTWIERNRIAFGSCTLSHGGARPGSGEQPDPRRAGMDRYCNIKPWSHNRVRLRVAEGSLNYVNASTVVVGSTSDAPLPPLRYIAMQGPTRQSLEYVWRMVAEQLGSPGVIVQLTNMVENGFQKCFPYFPMGTGTGGQGPGSDGESEEGGGEGEGGETWRLNEEDSWGDGWEAELWCEETRSLAGGAIELRKLRLRVISDGAAPEGTAPEGGAGEEEEEGRIVWHLLYTRWPDFGVPALEDLDSFFELMRLSREYAADDGATRVVHCSAGVGRTGTFIALEHLVRELDAGALERFDDDGDEEGLWAGQDEPRDLVFETVDGLRAQRRTMVQADAQLLFVYRVMKKLWVDRYGDPGVGWDEDGGGDWDGNGPRAAKRLEVEGELFTL